MTSVFHVYFFFYVIGITHNRIRLRSRYATSYLLQRQSGVGFEALYEAGRRGRAGEDCRTLFMDCNAVWGNIALAAFCRTWLSFRGILKSLCRSNSISIGKSPLAREQSLIHPYLYFALYKKSLTMRIDEIARKSTSVLFAYINMGN